MNKQLRQDLTTGTDLSNLRDLLKKVKQLKAGKDEPESDQESSVSHAGFGDLITPGPVVQPLKEQQQSEPKVAP